MFIAVDQAIESRLEGKPRDRHGNPQDPVANPGVRIPVFERRNQPGRGGFAPFRVIPNQWQQIPIYNKTTTGREWEAIFPCVTFDLVGISPNHETWLPPVAGNRICLPVDGSDIEVTNDQGLVIATGKSVNKYRPLGDPLDLMYQIEVHSKIEYETYYILRALNRVFPIRTHLVVPQADSSSQVLDMSLEGDLAIVEQEEPAFEGATEQAGEQRYRKYALTYLVEAYIDTSWDYYQSTGVPITSIELEMTRPDVPQATDVSSVAGVLETIDLTKLM